MVSVVVELPFKSSGIEIVNSSSARGIRFLVLEVLELDTVSKPLEFGSRAISLHTQLFQ
jgi:hypothetical protein